ncbi:FAD-dependent oxidoreductase [Novisyntrophococcus fermenticellae]|uniref:FAD-dependent oxidoreductase n=1 Tax=Novisyntrophococcus fermenticellae TaxID=2068655 RepID=UPI001E4F7711|nr:FAD-dependent oxidoreductase [Novisyntrophococcus fermenticellae]
MKPLYDVIIVGGGPAGLSAAIYLGRAKYRVLVIEKEKIGGQITITSDVVNYPGILQTSGEELTEQMKKQALHFGAEFLIGTVDNLNFSKDIKVVSTDRGSFTAFGVVLATGASPRKIGFIGEEEYTGKGVAYCATCDGEFFTGLPVFVIGGGFAAAEEAVFLTKYAKKVTVIVREEYFTCAESIAQDVMENEQIEVFFQTELLEVSGEHNLQKALFRDNAAGTTYEYIAETRDGFGVFVFAGYVPASSLFAGKVDLTETGYLITDKNQKTSVSGVYGAGDICLKDLRQVVTAVSDGATAATSLEKYITALCKKLHLDRVGIENLPIDKEPSKKVSKNSSQKPEAVSTDTFIDSAMKDQLIPIFNKFERSLLLKGYVDNTSISSEVESFLKELAEITPKIQYKIIKKDQDTAAFEHHDVAYPSIALYDEQEQYLGVQFHGVPGGHEFNSFIVTLYNAAGPGQPVDPDLLAGIKALNHPIHIKAVVSLSCTMCPEVVMSASRIALENDKVKLDIFDMAHFPEIRDKYQIKSVPCMIFNDKDVHFGKKNIAQMLELLQS